MGMDLITPTDAIAAINRLGYSINPEVDSAVISAAVLPGSDTSTDRSVLGLVSDGKDVSVLKARFDDGSFIDISESLSENGIFELSAEQLANIAGGVLTGEETVLQIVAEDGNGNSLTTSSLSFSLVQIETFEAIPGQKLVIDFNELFSNVSASEFFIRSEKALPTGVLRPEQGLFTLTPAPDEIGEFSFTLFCPDVYRRKNAAGDYQRCCRSGWDNPHFGCYSKHR